MLVAGLGRLLAVRQLGWPTVPVRIMQDCDHAAALACLSENVTRSNLTPADEAVQLATLVEHHPEGTIGVAHQLGRSQTWVEDRLDILTWPQDLIEHVHDRRISLAAAKHLARIADTELRTLYIHDAAENGISARTASQWRRAAEANAPQEQAPPENSVFSPAQTLQTITRVVCFGCGESHNLEDTTSQHICRGCLHMVTSAQQEAQHQPPPLQPQEHAPGEPPPR